MSTETRFHPLRFIMWLGIASIIMLFASLTSAYIIRQGAGGWDYFILPWFFWLNTAVILLSSFFMHRAVKSYKKYELKKYLNLLGVTIILGSLFLAGQFAGWQQMNRMGFTIDGPISGSFVWTISIVHAAHIAGGLVIMLISYARHRWRAFNPNKLVNVQVMATYWHFVDVLWIYLFIFFQIKLV